MTTTTTWPDAREELTMTPDTSYRVIIPHLNRVLHTDSLAYAQSRACAQHRRGFLARIIREGDGAEIRCGRLLGDAHDQDEERS